MALYINNPDVVALAEQLAMQTGKTKVAVVKEALEAEASRLREKPSLAASVKALQARVREDGFMPLPDEKAFMDDLSGGI